MQTNEKMSSHPHKGQSAKASTITRTSKLVENNARTNIANKTSKKQKQTSKLVQPIKPSYMVDLTKTKNLKWVTKMGFQTLVAHG